MRKEHALEIIACKKPLEIRTFSDFYCKMFTDQALVDANEKLRKEGLDDECTGVCRTDVGFVHFHNYTNSWTLDVEIDEIGMALMVEDDITWLADEFGFHDYDSEWQQYAHLPDEEKPLFFWLHIVGVVNRTGI
jgi:hypothetical protein